MSFLLMSTSNSRTLLNEGRKLCDKTFAGLRRLLCCKLISTVLLLTVHSVLVERCLLAGVIALVEYVAAF